jgi:hypothetical protein
MRAVQIKRPVGIGDAASHGDHKVIATLTELFELVESS